MLSTAKFLGRTKRSLLTTTGYTYTESRFDSAQPSANLWDVNTSTYWRLLSYSAADWCTIDFGASNNKTVVAYDMYATDAVYIWTAWTLGGSNDNIVYTTVDTRSGLSQTVSAYNNFTCSSPGSYRYYKFSLLSSGSVHAFENEIRFYV